MEPDAPVLTIELDGWEGPLDLLLALARTQKVDLRRISILALAEQYLRWIDRAAALRLELAADWLVMAAWLAYLKSALLLPREPDMDPDPEELALRLQLRLERLNAMREAGARLLARDRIGRDVFTRGDPEGLHVVRKARWDASLYELIGAYGRVSARIRPVLHVVRHRPVMTLEVAIARVETMLGTAIDWTLIGDFLPADADERFRRSALASTFLAALELARQGRVAIRQDAPFGPIELRPVA
ncbi:ScpA family protein [Sphingomonas sp. T9W2]|uniref:segregation and condensation protein A n=1 Tax=Sphingomonas sp. T9W2 TaxID=3143183 RepID=UPI0031F590B0